MITVIHGGQTGVDRGAHEGAIANGWAIAGYMPKSCCDELGPIPGAVARHLRENTEGGYAERTEANVRSSDALLVVVPDVREPLGTPGTAMTITRARDRWMPVKIVDPRSVLDEVIGWLSGVRRSIAASPRVQASLFSSAVEPTALRLMIAGPRASRWTDGCGQTARLVQSLAELLAATTELRK